MINWVKRVMGLSDEIPCLHTHHNSDRNHSGPGVFWVEEKCPYCSMREVTFACQMWYDYLQENSSVVCSKCKSPARSLEFRPTILARYND